MDFTNSKIELIIFCWAATFIFMKLIGLLIVRIGRIYKKLKRHSLKKKVYN